MNQLNIIGYVGAEPEFKTFESGAKLAKFSVAIREMAGTKNESTLWVQIEAWNNMAERVEKAITRGREVQVTGRLAVSKYKSKQKDGSEVEVERPVLKLERFTLCGKKPQAESNEQSADTDTISDESASPKNKRTKAAA
ncbi:MAG: single-stranded DNA-binding protein [Candidatus Obscuribacterales bacterium]|nr:single-stranded DNA-binding protein [Candidatus Obscuribacterales bacterium]